MSSHKPTVTIGIPAHNEAENIKNLLFALLKQKQEKYILSKIIVSSDNSSDNTVILAREVDDKRIVVIENKTRVGKNQRVNQIIKLCKSNILVLIDADTIPKKSNTIDLLITPFIKNPKVVYTSGHPIQVSSSTFIGKAIQVGRGVWDKVRDEIKEGKGIYTCHGQLYAIRTEFAKKNLYPKEMWTDSTFYYFTCLKSGYIYTPVKKAEVFFSPPSTIKDHISQIGRYQNLNDISINFFGEEIRKEFDIPKDLLFRYKLEAFLFYPLHCLVLFVINFYAKYFTKISKKINSGVWETQKSTKKTITLQ